MSKIIIPTNSEINISNKNSLNKINSDYKDYLNKIFEKPWGFEYLSYKNENIGIWILHVLQNQKTSLHCHFKKDTLLLVLSGSFKIETYESYYILNECETLYFPANTFHGIMSYSPESIIMEIEIYSNSINYSDKNDLLRIKDPYIRDNNRYESSVVEKDISPEISVNFHNKEIFNLGNSKIIIKKQKRADSIKLKNSKLDLMILLKGKIYNENIIMPGSIINNLKESVIIDNELEYMIISNNFKNENKKIIYNKEQLKDLLNINKFNNIGLTSGCFDIVHNGHLHNLKICKQNCDTLFVCLSSDKQISEIKGNLRPINNIVDRYKLLSNFSFIDYIILYDEIDNNIEKELDNIMNILNPTYWFKGSDYIETEIINIHPGLKNVFLINNIPNISTTNIINKINNINV